MLEIRVRHTDLRVSAITICRGSATTKVLYTVYGEDTCHGLRWSFTAGAADNVKVVQVMHSVMESYPSLRDDESWKQLSKMMVLPANS